MAIAPTGDIYKALSFDNTSSRNYGVYITGQAVYNAPERDVEMISIPGRNGAFALDKGRFQNIEVTYPAGIFADNETDFAQAVSDFRNFLCSRKGYVRLTDEYNPNEYRMAIYKSGLEVEPAQLKAGEFEITFDCQPQRYLTSGEAATTVANNGTMTNPTLFESSPLLEVTGYGEIHINGNPIYVENVPIGEVIILGASREDTSSTSTSKTKTLDFSSLEAGDPFALNIESVETSAGYGSSYTITSVTVASTTLCSATAPTVSARRLVPNPMEFVYGTNGTITASANFTETWKKNGVTSTHTNTVSIQATYTASTNKIQLIIHADYGEPWGPYSARTMITNAVGNSSKSAIAGVIYIDLDIGEAWNDNSGALTPLNNAVQMPAILPTLVSGTNTFTKSNTITQLKVTPRWWKV